MVGFGKLQTCIDFTKCFFYQNVIISSMQHGPGPCDTWSESRLGGNRVLADEIN